MKRVLVLFVAVILLTLGFTVLRGLYQGGRYALAAAADSVHLRSFDIGNGGPKLLGPYTIHGTVLMDTSQGIPAVPYIAYLNTRNSTSTKQLVYMDARACAPGAGDFPCVPQFSASTGYPRLFDGEAVEATGYIYENRFLVTSLSGE